MKVSVSHNPSSSWKCWPSRGDHTELNWLCSSLWKSRLSLYGIIPMSDTTEVQKQSEIPHGRAGHRVVNATVNLL